MRYPRAAIIAQVANAMALDKHNLPTPAQAARLTDDDLDEARRLGQAKRLARKRRRPKKEVKEDGN